MGLFLTLQCSGQYLSWVSSQESPWLADTRLFSEETALQIYSAGASASGAVQAKGVGREMGIRGLGPSQAASRRSPTRV